MTLLQHAQQFDLHGRGQLSDLVEEEGSPVGQFKSSFTAAGSSGKGPFLVSKEFRFDECFRKSGDVASDEGAAGARTDLVNVAGKDLFPRPRLTRDQYGGAGLSNGAGLILDSLQGGTRPDDAPVGLAQAAQLLAQLLDLSMEGVALRGIADEDQQFVDAERFRKGRITASLDHLPFGREILIPRDDDDGKQGPTLPHPLEDGKPLGNVIFRGGHMQVTDDHIDLLSIDQGQGFFPGRGLEDSIVVFEDHGHLPPNRFLVIHQEDGGQCWVGCRLLLGHEEMEDPECYRREVGAAAATDGAAGSVAYGTLLCNGRMMLNSVPRPTWLATSIRPPCCSMMSRQE